MILTGVGRSDITPPIGISHAGWGAAVHEQAEGIDMPLFCTSLYMKSESTKEEVLFIDLDLCVLTDDLDSNIRDRICNSFDIKRENIRISVTHTHSGPALGDGGWLIGGNEYIQSYKRILPELIFKSVNDSIVKTFPSRIGIKEGSCDININRRPADHTGKLFTGRNWEGFVDHGVIVIGIDDIYGKPIATIVNYACHPTVLGPENRLISPDFPGHMRATVEGNVDGLCLFLQGAAGNQGPVHGFVGDVEVARKAGKILGLEVSKLRIELDPFERKEELIEIVASGADLGIYEDLPVGEPSDVITVHNRKVELPSLDFPTIEEAEESYQKAIKDLQSARELADEILIKSRVSTTKRAGFMKNLSKIAELGRVQIWIQTIKIGNVIFQGLPVEPFAETGLKVKNINLSGFKVVFSGYSNGSLGYLPTIEAYEEGGYETGNTPFAAGGAEEILDICIQEVKNIAGKS